jgi:uncharacterized OB-fold protein
MSDRTSLFQIAGTSALPGRPALCGGRCTACGFTFFPMQTFGCERCGDVASLSPTLLSGRGQLVNAVKVHLHTGPGRVAPFWVGSIVTDDGAFVRAVLDPGGRERLSAGDIVVSRLVESGADGESDLHFVPESEAARG